MTSQRKPPDVCMRGTAERRRETDTTMVFDGAALRSLEGETAMHNHAACIRVRFLHGSLDHGPLDNRVDS